MSVQSSREDRFNWQLPLFTGAGAFIVFCLIVIPKGDVGIDTLFYTLVVSPLVGLVLLAVGIAFAIRKKRYCSLSVLSMLGVYLIVSWACVKNSVEMRGTGRWLLGANSYKRELFKEPMPTDGEFRRIQFDAWGFPGAGYTVMYLVFDPDDSLAALANGRLSGKVNRLPCAVSLVRRLERQWYSVMFYTDTDWNHCR